MRRLALVVALAAACKPFAERTTTRPPSTANEAPRRSDPELTAAADRMDPGPQAPLYESLPTWLKGQIDASVEGDPKAARTVAEAREAIAGWNKLKPGDDQETLRGALQLGRGLVLAERAVAAGSDDPELLAALSSAYRVVHGFKMFLNPGFLGRILSLGAEMARKEGKLEGQQIEEAMAALAVAVERAPALHLHTTARLLREHPDHPTVPEVLLGASQARLDAELYEEGVALRKLAVARKGKAATGGDYVGLAGACHVALDLACADLARKTAEAMGPGEPGEDKAAAFKKRLADLDESGAAARKAVALASSSTLEAQTERGHLLLRLNRVGDAERTFTALQAAHPNDARPLTGLAVTAGRRQLDFAAVTTHIRAARNLAGRDRLYYEVALGTVPVALIAVVATQYAQAPDKPVPELDAHFAEMLELARGFRQYDPARAAVLELLFTSAREAVPKFMSGKRAPSVALVRGLGMKALALTKKFPESLDAWRMVFSTARLVDDAAKARMLVTTPLPAALQQHPDLRLQQARALFDVAVLWEDKGLLTAAAQAAASLPAEVDADTATTVRATIDAVLGRQGDQAALQRAVDAFAALAQRKTGKEQAIAFNNAGMVVAFAGDVQTAMGILARAQEAGGEETTPGYNMAALAFGLQAREGLPELFAAIVQGSSSAALRVQAHAWLVALADAGQGDVAVTRKDFAAALAKEQAEEIRGRLSQVRWGVVEQGEFKVSLGYSTVEGLTLLDEVVPHWWLVTPAPNLDALLAGGKGKPAKPAKPAPR